MYLASCNNWDLDRDQYSFQIQCRDSDWDGFWLIQYLCQIQSRDSDWDGLWLIQHLFQILYCDLGFDWLWQWLDTHNVLFFIDVHDIL